MKKRGFGAHLWNGFGGKVDPNETITAAAIREMEEESGVTPKDPKFIGLIQFNMLKDEKTIIVHVFKSNSYTGEIKESEEMKPEWFETQSVDFSKMWPDDKIWFPDMIQDNYFFGGYSFEAHSELTSQSHKLITQEELLQLQKKLSKISLV